MPGDQSLPSPESEFTKIASWDKNKYPYSVEDYFSKPKMTDFDLSPDGSHISYKEKNKEGKGVLCVKDIKTGLVTPVITEKEEIIRGYSWINNKRIIYMSDKGGDENTQIFAVNIDGTNAKALTPAKVKAEFNSTVKSDENSIIILMNKDNPEVLDPYRLNIVTGKLVKLLDIRDNKKPILSYDFDENGRLRAYTRKVEGTIDELMFRSSGETEFRLVKTTNWKDNFSIIDFDYSDKTGNRVYVASNLNRDKVAIQLYDMKENKVLKTLFEHPDYDASSLSISAKGGHEVNYYSYYGDKREIVPVSDAYKKLNKRFEQQFKGYGINVESTDKNEDKYLLKVYSDKLYGTYYLYDTVKDEFEKIIDIMPQLVEKDMAARLPISFQSRDGITIHGYLTLPQGAGPDHQVPLIVNPHGGPYTVRDTWGFNPETQLFASRGYATLSVDYRGSGGYGKNFAQKGYKQIGRNMLNDLEDGVKYVISQGSILKDKIAIYGGSYGGLATLGSLVKTPDLYACAVDYCGVSNLFSFKASFPPYWKPLMKQVDEQWYNEENAEEKQIMTAVSPALNSDKITRPLFVIQGANDPRVNINEADQMVKGLRARGVEVPYLVRYNEGHGFQHEENRIVMYKAMLGFFARYLK